MTRVAKGDEQALLVLYDQYSSRVYALALKMLGDSMAAEEITQDVFLKVWSRARTFLSVRGPLISWLMTIARNSALDRIRMERRRPTLTTEDDPEDTWEVLPDEKTTMEEERWRSLYFAVQSLAAEQRQVIELSYYYGMSHSEISDTLQLPLGTVKTRLRLGMDHLRSQWLLKEDTPGASETRDSGVLSNRDRTE